MQDHSINTPVRSSAFSLDAVASALERAGLLTLVQANEVLEQGRKREMRLKRKFKTRDSEQPYVSPIEVIAAFGFPCQNPRLVKNNF